MREYVQEFPRETPPQEKAAILVVTSEEEDARRLREILHHPAWEIRDCGGVHEAEEMLAAAQPAIVICERELRDGIWCDLLERRGLTEHPPLLLVMSKQADERLWSEVLNRGGYDVLLKPFEQGEVARVVSSAWIQWRGAAPRKKAISGAT